MLRAHEQSWGESLVARWDPAGDAAALRRLAVWCGRFAPIVAIDPLGVVAASREASPGADASASASRGGGGAGEAGLLFDLAGCDAWLRHRHGRSGESPDAIESVELAARHGEAVEAALRRLGFTACVAAAPTVGLAWALSRHGPGAASLRCGGGPAGDRRGTACPSGTVAGRCVDAAGAAAMLGTLPIESLRIDPAAADALRQLQIACVASLHALDRSEVVQRFGPLPLRRLDEALGMRQEPLEPVRLPSPLRVEWAPAAAVGSREGVRRVVASMVEELCDRLRARERGVVHLRLQVECVDRPRQLADLPLGAPSRRRGHLWSLLEVHLERIDLGLGCERIELSAVRTAAMRRPQGAMEGIASAEDPPPGDAAAAELADAVASRFEASPLLQAEAAGEHAAERAAVLRPVGMPHRRRPPPGSSRRIAAEVPGCASWASALRPTRLLRSPEPIEVRFGEASADARRLEEGMRSEGEGIGIMPLVAETAPSPVPPQPTAVRWQGHWRAVLAAEGPERIADAWWRPLVQEGAGAAEAAPRGRSVGVSPCGDAETPPPIREYWRVAVVPGVWIWIFREASRGRWFLHGIWS